MKRLANNGYTLIEVLTAIMVLAISILVILQLFSGSLKAVRLSEDYTRAIYYAQEKMETLLIQDDKLESEYQGQYSDGYDWVAFVSPHMSEEEKINGQALLEITVRVSWSEGHKKKMYELKTLKISKIDPNS